MDDFPQNSLIIIKFETKKIRILSLNETIDTSELLGKLIEKYGGKGGGNPKSSQGFLENMPENIISDIETFILSN